MACFDVHDRSRQAGPGHKPAINGRPATRGRRHPQSGGARLANRAANLAALSALAPEDKSRFIFRYGASSLISLDVNDAEVRHAG
jgi:hypothetical protein